MQRLRALVARIGDLWRAGRRGKLAVGCGGLVALWLVCSVCTGLSGLGRQSATASPTATVSAAIAIAPPTSIIRPTDAPPTRVASPTSIPPTTPTTAAAVALPSATTAPPRPTTVPPSPTTSTNAPAPPSPIPATSTPAGPGWPDGTTRASIVEVVDGDTVKVNVGGRTETIRLIGIDTPETVDRRVGVQCFGREASAYAKDILRVGAAVGIEADPTQGERDKYSRLLRYIWLEDGALFNLQAIAAGYAHEYTYDLPYKYQAQFKQAERQARDAEIGLWSPSTCAGDTDQLADAPSAPPAAPAVSHPRNQMAAKTLLFCVRQAPPSDPSRRSAHWRVRGRVKV